MISVQDFFPDFVLRLISSPLPDQNRGYRRPDQKRVKGCEIFLEKFKGSEKFDRKFKESGNCPLSKKGGCKIMRVC